MLVYHGVDVMSPANDELLASWVCGLVEGFQVLIFHAGPELIQAFGLVPKVFGKPSEMVGKDTREKSFRTCNKFSF